MIRTYCGEAEDDFVSHRGVYLARKLGVEETSDQPAHLLRQFARAHRRSYSLSILSIIASEAITVQFPSLLGRFTDALQAGRLTGQLVVVYSLWLLLVGVAYVVLYGLGQWWNGRMGRVFEYELRKQLFDHWQTLPTAYFRHRSIGDLLNHAMNDVRTVREAMSGGLNMLTNAVFLLVATLVMTFRTISIELTLASIIPLLFLPLFVVYWGPKIRSASRRVQEGLSDMADLTEESLSAIRLIKATANEEVEGERFGQRVQEIVGRQMSVFRLQALFQSLIPLTGSISFAIALLYGGYLTVTHQILLGSFVAFTLYLTMIITPLQQMGFVFNFFQRGSASLARLTVLFGERADITDPPHPVSVSHLTGTLEIDLPEFVYPNADTPSLQDIHFTVMAGQTVGIVGRTGAGKTTLVNLLPRIFDPPPGAVRIDGYDVHALRLQVLREAIAYVPQDGFLFSTTIAENIGFGKDQANSDEVAQAARHAAFWQEIEDFPAGMETVVGERGVSLSGGQRQRASMARAFVKDAPILILDDSLSAVDMNTEKRIIANIHRLREGKTTLIIAHRLSAVRHADFILVLDEGRLVERGSHEELLHRNGIYATLYRLQESEKGELA